MEQFPALNADCFDQQISERLNLQEPPRFLILYGSVRERSYSRFAAEEAGRLLTAMGAEFRLFDPFGLPCRMSARILTQKSSKCATR
jgi:arsenic resistance protein ArsH